MFSESIISYKLTIRNSTHQDLNFTQKNGLGISKFLTHVSSECQDLIQKLLLYNPEERYSAKQALAHPYFKELTDQEAKMAKMSLNNGFSNPNNFMKSFHNDSQSLIKR
jgi:serine/threonine protein kinase